MAVKTGENLKESRSFVIARIKRIMRKSTGSNVTASAGGSSKSKKKDEHLPAYPFYAICVENEGYEPCLQLGKSYRVIKPRKNDPDYFFRVIDEEQEDYLYPRDWFVPVDLPQKQKRRVAAALK
jgi:hypothetical protein